MVIERFYLGTWQLGGDFKQLSHAQKTALIDTALSEGVCRFDTAAVYGGGSVETLLGARLPKTAAVLTKIPAKAKPTGRPDEHISHLYPRDWIRGHVYESSRRFARDHLDIVLLHNWSSAWTASQACEILGTLVDLQTDGTVGRIGISLPNRFNTTLDTSILAFIQVLEMPYNIEDNWARHSIGSYRHMGIEVILRSLFMQGMLIKPPEYRAQLHESDLRSNKPYPAMTFERTELLNAAWSLGTSITVGATNPKQLIANLQTLREWDPRE